MLLLKSEDHVKSLTPDYEALKRQFPNVRNFIIAYFRSTTTSSQRHDEESNEANADKKLKEYDIIYRVFCPVLQVNEDKVTGSAFCVLLHLHHDLFNTFCLPTNDSSPRENIWLHALQASQSPGELRGRFRPAAEELYIRGEARVVSY